MPRYGRWAAALAASALAGTSVAAQLLPNALGEATSPLPPTSPPALPLPAVPLPAVPLPAVPKPTPIAGAVEIPKVGSPPLIESGTLLGTGVAPLKTILSTNPLGAVHVGPVELTASGNLLSPPAGLSASPTLQLSTYQLANALPATAASLEAARKRRLQDLIRHNPQVLEADDQGHPVVRGKLLVLDPHPDLLDRARLAGFQVISDRLDPDLRIRVAELGVPAGLGAAQSLRRLRSLAPGVQADFDHIFEPAGGTLGSASARVATARYGGRPLIGMVDGGVADHPSLAGAAIEQKGFAGIVRSSAHGTAVASLLVGRQGRFRGAAEGASLAVADVYGGRSAAGSASAILRGLGWLAAKQPRVINISLVGPPNRLLAAAIKGVQARNIDVVAAIGNDGPASPPQYPASYSGVVAITGVDAGGRALPEAGNAAHVDFAAPAADMAAARPGEGYERVRGTSFAAPLAAGRLAKVRSVEQLAVEARPGKGRVGRGVVCAACRTDPADLRR